MPKQRSQIASYSELFTVAIWYWLVGQSYRKLFPKLPEYSRYHRIVRNAEKLWATLALEVVGDSVGEFKIVDAKPLPVAKGKRAQ